jgi:biopolymer transport protein ExbD
MAEMNITPMVDVMLVLLVIFMVTAPMLLAGAPVNLAKSDARRIARAEKPLVLTITADRRILIRDEPTTDNALESRLVALRAAEGDKTLYLRADAAVSYGEIVVLLGRLHAAGLDRIALLSKGARATSERGP